MIEEGCSALDPSPWLEALREAIAHTLASEDPEGPHRIRAALARLRIWLVLGGRRALLRELTWLRRRAGKVRDLDVQLKQHPPDAWREDLERRRRHRRARLSKALRSKRTTRLLEALEQEPRLPAGGEIDAVARMARQAWKIARELPEARRETDAIHVLRKRIRSLRFGLDWMGGSPSFLSPLQDALGRVCDRSAALADLRRRRRRVHAPAGFRRRVARKRRIARAKASSAVRASLPSLEALALGSVVYPAAPRVH
jgi:CHAD domain-containing protein